MVGETAAVRAGRRFAVHIAALIGFGITLVKIPKNGGGRMWFGIPTDTKKISLIGVPNLSFCD